MQVLTPETHKEVEKLLGQFYDDNSAPFPQCSGLGALGPPMDSLTAVEFLIELEDLVGNLPVSVVKEGGYQNREEFVTELSESIRSFAAST